MNQDFQHKVSACGLSFNANQQSVCSEEIIDASMLMIRSKQFSKTFKDQEDFEGKSARKRLTVIPVVDIRSLGGRKLDSNPTLQHTYIVNFSYSGLPVGNNINQRS